MQSSVIKESLIWFLICRWIWRLPTPGWWGICPKGIFNDPIFSYQNQAAGGLQCIIMQDQSESGADAWHHEEAIQLHPWWNALAASSSVPGHCVLCCVAQHSHSTQWPPRWCWAAWQWPQTSRWEWCTKWYSCSSHADKYLFLEYTCITVNG